MPSHHLPVKGLSLLEVMVVILIVSVVAGMGSIGIRPLWEKQQLNSTATDLKNRLQVYRMKAIVENCSYQLTVQQRQVHVRSNQEETWSEWKKVHLNSPVSISHSGSISFSEKGFASPKTINLQHGTYRKKLIININGRIRESQIY